MIPPIGKKLLVLIDDINLAQKEIWGAIPPIEFLR